MRSNKKVKLYEVVCELQLKSLSGIKAKVSWIKNAECQEKNGKISLDLFAYYHYCNFYPQITLLQKPSQISATKATYIKREATERGMRNISTNAAPLSMFLCWCSTKEIKNLDPKALFCPIICTKKTFIWIQCVYINCCTSCHRINEEFI